MRGGWPAGQLPRRARALVRAVLESQPEPPRRVTAGALALLLAPAAAAAAVAAILALEIWLLRPRAIIAAPAAVAAALLALWLLARGLAVWRCLRRGPAAVGEVVRSELAGGALRPGGRGFTLTVRYSDGGRELERRVSVSERDGAVPRPGQRLRLLLWPSGGGIAAVAGHERRRRG